MCGFLFIRSLNSISTKDIYSASTKISYRGPDDFRLKKFIDNENYKNYFLHYLLDISGEKITQPLEDKDKILLFNGEIYNYPKDKFATDSHYLLNYDTDLNGYNNENLNGEYAYLKFFKNKNSCLVGIDTFMTKPLFYGFCEKKKIFLIASYKSALDFFKVKAIKFKPNSITNFIFYDNKIDKKEFKNTSKVFNLIQDSKNYLKWENAFLKAVEVRATHGKGIPFVSLSSGYDSGAICCALNVLNLKYETFTVMQNENLNVLEKRFEINKKDGQCINNYIEKGITFFESLKFQNDIKNKIDNFQYYHFDRGKKLYLNEDGGALGALKIAKSAKLKKFKIHLSSCGSDEIISDYGFNGEKFFQHSQFGGLFPDDLSKIFPWEKFYGNSQRSYLFKEEYIFGRYGLESRYPFLDIEVVQSFLKLNQSLKNNFYKAPIHYFLEKYSYPFDKGKKTGFNPRKYNIVERVTNKLKYYKVKNK